MTQGQVVCINDGTDYDFSFATDDTEKDVKIFRGALDNYFARAEKGAGDDNQPHATPPKAAPSAPPKAKAPAAAEEPKAKAAAAPAAHVEVPPAEAKPKAPAAAPKASVAAEEPKAKAASAPPSVPSVELAAGEKELCDDVKCLGVKSGCKLVYTPGAGSATGSFWFVGDAASNRKIQPNTKLHLIREGSLKSSSEEGAVPYELAPAKKTMVCVLQSSDRTDLSEPKALEAVISDMKIKKITLLDDLPAPGACPAGGLTGKSGYAFVPTSDEVKKLVQDARTLGQAKFLWVFKYNAQQAQLTPYGVVLCTSKQALVTAKIRCALS